MYSNFEIVKIINAAASKVELMEILLAFVWLIDNGEMLPKNVIHYTALKKYIEF